MSGKAEGVGQSLSEGSGSAGREAGRAKPFVGWMIRPHAGWQTYDHEPNTPHSVAVVVTPLLDGDPRPGEVWEYRRSGFGGCDVTVLAVFDGAATGDRMAYVRRHDHGTGEIVSVSHISRKPALKTFRLTDRRFADWQQAHADIIAESKDAALAKLADMLEEVR